MRTPLRVANSNQFPLVLGNTMIKSMPVTFSQPLENLRGAGEDLKKCVVDFKGVLLYLKVKEGSLKVLNDEFGPMWSS